MIRIMLGSQSPLKRAAVDAVLAILGIDAAVTEVAAASGVNAQPVGEEETMRGAENRARGAQAQGSEGCWGLGIENGIRQADDETWEDFAIVVLLSPRGERFTAQSAPVQFPADAVQEARDRGFATTTVGHVLAEMKPGCDHRDPQRFLTGDKMGRKLQLITALEDLLQNLQ